MKAPDGVVLDRLAGAPISWGVCEVPGWGVMLPAERVLAEMAALGLGATELGALGYLGKDSAEIKSLLEAFGLGAVGGFVPLVLQDRSARRQLRAESEAAARLLSGAGATYFVTAAVLDHAWSEPVELDATHWDDLAGGLALVEQICAEHGLVQVLHPHVGTLVEQSAHLDAVLARSEVAWCLDTGHLAIGGTDPLAFAERHADRVELVHLKDVEASLAAPVRRHELSLLEATRGGLFRPLGQGSLPLAAVVGMLESHGYLGWYVLEQDTTIEPALAGDADPAREVEASIEHLRSALGCGAGEGG